MKAFNIKNIFIIVMSIMIINGCQKDLVTEIQNSIDDEVVEANYNQRDGLLKLGKKINDPFAIYNMKNAVSNLKSAGVDVPEEELVPNKIYLRFLPKSEEEWQILKNDTNLILYDYPLDYEIEVYGTYYHDPELPDSSITWQYSVIPV